MSENATGQLSFVPEKEVDRVKLTKLTSKGG